MFYIEVTSGDWSWLKHFNGERGLHAPKMKKYKTLFTPLKKGDIILTHLTLSLTRKREWRGNIIGISTLGTEMYEIKNKYLADLINPVELITPIKFKDYKFNNSLSKELKSAISMSLQKYLINITKKDFITLMKIYPENLKLLEKTDYQNIF